MATTYEILHSVRLTGRIDASGELEIITMRNHEPVEALGISSDSPPRVRVELYDFLDGSGQPWQFPASDPWQRGEGPYVWAEFTGFHDGEAFDSHTLAARPQGQTSAAAQEKPKQIYIKIKPIIDGGPDED